MGLVHRLGSRLGPSIALWAVMPALFTKATAAPWGASVAIATAGAVTHLGCRMISNRLWFAGRRSVAALSASAVAISAGLSAILLGLAGLAASIDDNSVQSDRTLLFATWLLGAIALFTAFWGRVEFRGWIIAHAKVARRTQPFATSPIGPDRATVHDLLDHLDEVADSGEQSLARVVKAATTRVKVASDDRYRRPVPWSVAQPLLQTFTTEIGAATGSAATVAIETSDDRTAVLLGPICDLLYELSRCPQVEAVEVDQVAEPAHGVTIRIVVSGDVADPLREWLTPSTARSLAHYEVIISRPDPRSLRCELCFVEASAPDADQAIDEYFTDSAMLLDESTFSAGARRVYRRGDAIIKVQLRDRADAKPTLLEDEFHLLRRLRGRSSRFPTALGYGRHPAFSWISYSYVEGQPLQKWLEEHGAGAGARLLSFGVDLDEMLVELAAARVAHRDLNPGNVICQPDGSLVLIDFDQAARGTQYVGADLSGADQGLAKNDIEDFLERSELTRAANELHSALDAAWPAGAPYSLGVLGQRFGEGWQLDPLLNEARRRLGSLSTARVLECSAHGPIAGLMLASAGATVSAVVADPSPWQRLADLVGLSLTTWPDSGAEPYDLVIAIDTDLGPARAGPVLREYSGRTDDRPLEETWFVTTALTQLGI